MSKILKLRKWIKDNEETPIISTKENPTLVSDCVRTHLVRLPLNFRHVDGNGQVSCRRFSPPATLEEKRSDVDIMAQALPFFVNHLTSFNELVMLKHVCKTLNAAVDVMVRNQKNLVLATKYSPSAWPLVWPKFMTSVKNIDLVNIRSSKRRMTRLLSKYGYVKTLFFQESRETRLELLRKTIETLNEKGIKTQAECVSLENFSDGLPTEFIEALVQWAPRVKCLNLTGSPIDEPSLKMITEKLTDLNALFLYGSTELYNKETGPAESLKQIRNKLIALDLGNTRVGDNVIKALTTQGERLVKEMEEGPLLYLRFHFKESFDYYLRADKVLTYLASKYQKLKVLELTGDPRLFKINKPKQENDEIEKIFYYHSPSIEGFMSLGLLIHLETLVLDQYVDDYSLLVLAADCIHLRALHLRKKDNIFSQNGFIELCSVNSKLKSLEIHSEHLERDAATSLCNLKNLEQLDISYTSIGDLFLNVLLECPKLSRLAVKRNSITSASIKLILKWKKEGKLNHYLQLDARENELDNLSLPQDLCKSFQFDLIV